MPILYLPVIGSKRVPPSEINKTDGTKPEDRIGWSLRRLSEMTGFAVQLPIAGNDRDLRSPTIDRFNFAMRRALGFLAE
jgi:hypothetical protein